MAIQIILLCGLIIFSVLAILLKDLIKAALSLAVASLFLGIIFFLLAAPYAGVFEISVVAGLITVLFVLTIALTKKDGEVKESRIVHLAFPIFFILFIVIDGLVMKSLLQKIPVLPIGPEAGTFGEVLWKQRTFDLVAQIGIILAGVLAVLALFRKKEEDKDE
ncbi:MAG: NADH-quinone oxidoreductase subunit J [Acidobacteriota bacterium]|nr:NADH-quinone oxidoreductase subunit J [Acidobacteriota bacterium]MDW3228407.1 NADH-quinone oxidoreductase subunit J [Acidobacteriota bacterium]MDY0231738.1 NADH-quinone oxidoreductase subunit J [Candidatus Saccharicenans sp.]